MRRRERRARGTGGHRGVHCRVASRGDNALTQGQTTTETRQTTNTAGAKVGCGGGASRVAIVCSSQ
eukprot:1662671-Prymnesium_polylepis.1